MPATATPPAATQPQGFTQQPPASPDGEVKKGRGRAKGPDKVPYGARNEKGDIVAPIKGKDVADWDSKKHLPLKKSDFETGADYSEWKADQLETQVARLRKNATEERTFGNAEKRRAIKKAQGLKAKFESLQKDLEALGVSPDQIASYLNG